ncbi:condensation domain-containing protein, partial [Rheinheimera gaetbuli]
YVVLETLPLTANGKVDRKTLPEPDGASLQAEYVAPRTETETLLCRIWQEVLGVERIGIHDNFFALGGHSLLLMQVISRLQKADIFINARQIFASQSLVELALSIDNLSSDQLHVNKQTFSAPANRIPAEAQQITPEMLSLIELCDEDIQTIVSQVPGGASNVQDIYPLGPLQEGILFHHMMSGESDPYVIPMLFSIRNTVAVQRFLQALQFVVDRHDTLRTAILWEGLTKPVQVVYRNASLPVSWIKADKGQDILAYMQRLCAPEVQKMDITKGPLVYIQVMVAPDSEEHYVLLQLHHIISDHVGLEVIQSEIGLYESGDAAQLAAPVPYREFIAHTLHQARNNDAEAYFRNVLGDVAEPTIPFNLKDIQGDGNQIIEYREQVPVDVSMQLRQVAKSLKVSPAALFHSAWAIVVGACSGRDDVVFGTVVSGRLQGTIGAESMMGVFINTLPFRVHLQGQDVEALVRQVQDVLLDLIPYEQTPLALAQKCSGLPGDTPLFSAMLNYRHSAGGLTKDVVQDVTPPAETEFNYELISAQDRSNYPFNLSVDDAGRGFGLDFQVDSTLNAERVAGYMQVVLAGLTQALVARPQLLVSELPVLSGEERQTQLVEWNNTAEHYPRGKGIHVLFEEQAAARPDAMALVFEDTSLSYGELNTKANQL